MVQWLADESRKALEEEGEHASVVFLGMPDGSVRAQRFDATGQHDVADAWGRVATWAKGVQATAVYFVAEAKRAHDDEPDDTELEEDVLILSALSAEGEEATFETPFERDDDGKVTRRPHRPVRHDRGAVQRVPRAVGPTAASPSTTVAGALDSERPRTSRPAREGARCRRGSVLAIDVTLEAAVID